MIVEINKKAIKDLSKIDNKEVDKILLKIDTLKDFPNVPNYKKLTNFDPPFRLRIGNYRALFNVDGDKVTVYRIRHRKESY